MEWSKEVYESSVSSRCWQCTPYDDGWDAYPPLREDNELKEIVREELELGPIPDWAKKIVAEDMGQLPMCGHYMFPVAFVEVTDSIGTQQPLQFMHGCFTVERGRKKQMMDYCLCLDAWLAGASPDAPARELIALSPRKVDWLKVCRDLWEILGEPTEPKILLVMRLLHLRRHQIKERIWDDDPASEFGRDEYLGDFFTEESGRRNPARGSCAVPLVHGFAEEKSPRVRNMEEKMRRLIPGWNEKPGSLRNWMLVESWLCAPMEFRYMERLLWAIGRGSERVNEGHVPPFLQIEDTIPDRKISTDWLKEFLGALSDWRKGAPASGKTSQDVRNRLGLSNPLKRWLVRLYIRKIQVLVATNAMVCKEKEGESSRS